MKKGKAVILILSYNLLSAIMILSATENFRLYPVEPYITFCCY